MYRQIPRMLPALITALILCVTGVIGAGAADNTAAVTVGGKTYTLNVGDIFEYSTAFTYSGSNLATAQVELPVDFSAFSGYSQEEVNAHLSKISPSVTNASVILHHNDGNTLGMNGYVMNFVSPGGYSFTSKKTVFTMRFTVKKAGSYTLAAKVRYIDDVNSNTIVDSSYNTRDSRFSCSETLTIPDLETPQVKVASDAGGMRISWEPVAGAANYRVYYKGSNGWTKLTDTTETSVLDTDVKNSVRYTYTVRCLSADGSRFTSDYDRDGKAAVYYAAPTLRLSNAEDGVSIKWDAIAGASKYRVYYKGRNGWTKLTDTAQTSVVDKDVVSGTNYTYTIRTMDSKGNLLSGYYTDGLSIRFIRAPEIRLSNAANGVTVSWSKVDGAEKYRVFYYGSRGWTRLADTAQTSILDTDVSSNHNYTYTVRCITEDGSAYTSDYRAGKKIKYYAAPKLTLSNAEDGVSIKWNAIAGASKYRVYYKGRNGWTKLTDTSGTSVVDKDVVSGTNYTYTIRAMDSKSNHLSWYYADGFRIRFIRAPEVKLSNAANGVTVSWSKVGGAEKYRVYYYGSKGWTRLADTTETSVLDTDVSSNHNYTYTVRCINTGDNAFTSSYRAGKKIKYYAAPKLSLSSTAAGVSIKWNAVAGASKYRIYYKGRNGWTKLTDTAGTSYVDTDVKNGCNYTYTIRAMDSKGNHLSWYYTDGFKIQYRK